MSDDLRITIEGESTSRSSAGNNVDAAVAAFRSERDRAVAERDQLRNYAAQSQYAAIDAGRAAALTEAQAAETESKLAYESGDTDAMVAAQRKMARAEAKALRYDEHKANLEAAHSTPVVTDPVEAYVQDRTEPTANWLRKHPEWVRDSAKQAKLTSAHYSAVADGITPDTPEYFRAVERTIGLRPNDRARDQTDTVLADGVTVHKRKSGEPIPEGAVYLTKAEYAAATDGTITWGRGPKANEPIGVREYIRRRKAMSGPEWQRLDDVTKEIAGPKS